MNKIYSRLAFTNIKNNKTLYMPYIISGMVMIAMFYVMMFLNNSKGLGKVPGADALASIMGLGCGTIAVFSYIFLFYTNSFIIKRRKKEVGIYNILGMEKRHIARVLIIETLTVALAAIVSGIIAGILFSKLMIMFLYRIINIKAQIDFAVSTGAVLPGDIILRLPQRALFRCFHCSLSQCCLSSSERIFYLFQEAL